MPYISQYTSVKNVLDSLRQEEKEELIEYLVKFILLALKGMKKKLPFKEGIWEDIKVIFFSEFNKLKWTSLKNHFKNIISNDELEEKFIHELGRLDYNFKRIQYQSVLTRQSPLTIWNVLKKDYPTLYLLAKALLVLPHASVPVERIFSTLKTIKNPYRNRLSIENVEACLLSYQHFRDTKMPIDFGNILIQKITSISLPTSLDNEEEKLDPE